MEQHNNELALTTLKNPSKKVQEFYGEDRYRVCMDEMIRCLEDPKAIPNRSGKLAEFLSSKEHLGNAQANVMYAMGRLCELRSDPKAAKQWYRASLDTQRTDYTFRMLAAVRLRELKDEYFK